MESSTIPPSSKKRSFPGEGSSSSGFSDAEISKPMPPMEKESNSEIHGTESDVMPLKKKPAKGETSDDKVVVDEVLRNFELFKKFDVVKDFSDHQFRDYIPSDPEEPSRKWPKIIRREWMILEKNLPDNIFVRVCESRIDLMRAVIVGPEGTPYHNGLFCFDILIPAGYPDAEPLFNWRSYGLPLHPAISGWGKMCLLLLNNLHARWEEIWKPSATILQVLVSIQGLVMIEKPYFFTQLEDADTSVPGAVEVRSLRYNEKTFVCSVQTMVLMLRVTPKRFEALVAGYFRKHARDILQACKAYLHGARVGNPNMGSVDDVDEAFKVKLVRVIKMVIQSFEDNGAKGLREEFWYLTESIEVAKRPTNSPAKRL